MTPILFVIGLAAAGAWILSRPKQADQSVPLLTKKSADARRPELVPDGDTFEAIMLLRRRLKQAGATPKQIHDKLDSLTIQLLDDLPDTAAATVPASPENSGA